MSQQVPADLIREVIREVLQEVVAAEVREVVAGQAPAPIAAGQGQVIAIRSQADLDAAIRRVIADAAHPARRAALQSGKVRFVLGEASHSPATQGSRHASTGAAGVHRVERGALTERAVQAAGQQGAIISITRRVVVTPLAKERARAMGVQIVKEG